LDQPSTSVDEEIEIDRPEKPESVEGIPIQSAHPVEIAQQHESVDQIPIQWSIHLKIYNKSVGHQEVDLQEINTQDVNIPESGPVDIMTDVST
jgi:hypothetical protein